MIYRTTPVTIAGEVKYFAEVKRNGRWVKVKSYGAVKEFNHPEHVENYLKKWKR